MTDAYKTHKLLTPDNSVSKKSEAGAFGGGTPYHQAKISQGFMAVPPIKGHTQQNNVKK